MARYRNFDDTPGMGMQALNPALNDVRLRRAGLKTALSGLELALAAPYANRVDWVMQVREALDAVRDVWSHHIAQTEAPSGFLDELVTESPRLATPASRLRREHADIRATIDREVATLATPPDDATYDAWADDLRVELTALLAALARHRQRGADLVYEAYAVDLGGG